MDFALNKLQSFICHKTQPNNQPDFCLQVYVWLQVLMKSFAELNYIELHKILNE